MNIYEQLIRDEGNRLQPYQDSLGYWTIGVGHLIDARRGGGISEEISEIILHHDVRDTIDQLTTALPWVRYDGSPRFFALVNMAFQLGVAGLLEFRRMLAACQRGDWPEAGAQALDSRWAKQTPARAKRIAEQIRTNEWK